MKKNIKDYDLNELTKELENIGEKKFRAEQIFRWLYVEKVKSFDEMTNLSLELRNKLKENFEICNFKILRKLVSKDGTIKYLFGLDDGNAIESVLMQYHFGKTVCVSSQIGCKMGCKFCASTGIPFIRSLSSGEIVEQIIAIEQDIREDAEKKDLGKAKTSELNEEKQNKETQKDEKENELRVSNVVFMGIGEPMDNFDNVLNAISILNNPKGLNIGARHISVSTSGVVPRIYEFADKNIQCTLSISLHSADDEIRSSMMPVNNAYNIEELMKACKYYIAKTNKRISFEYALAKDNNDNLKDAEELANLLKRNVMPR